MSDNGSTSTIPADTAEAPDDFKAIQSAVHRQQRKEAANRLKELKRQADGAKERARKAQERFEKAVVILASDKPERVDWYEHPGALPRKTLLEAGQLNTVTLHRIMERHRKAIEAKRPARKRPAKR